MTTFEKTNELSLDPTDWDALRALGHRMLDDMLDFQATVRERAPWQPVPAEIKQALQAVPPEQPRDAADVYADFQATILPYPLGNIHPRFWGWVIGTGDPVSVLAELLAATMNPNLGGGEHVANYVELQVIDWFTALLGFPPEASGLLVSGGSMANLVGLAVGRNVRAGFDLRKEGLAAAPRQLVFYASEETHSSNIKAAELLGLGSDALRLIPVNDAFEIDLAALQAAIAADKAAGLQPFAIIGHAGTVNTGATDDLDALADLAAQEGLWFHVDGAFGALAALAPGLRDRVKGMERADSLAFDLHKWIGVPIEAGCVLIRREEDHRQAFATTATYLTHGDRGTASGAVWFGEYGPQLSRGFRALKVWMAFHTHGVSAYRQVIQQNVDQAAYLSARVDSAPEMERLAPTALNIVCFRYNPGHLDEARLNALNQELLIRLQERGIAVPSGTVVHGHYAIRVANVNHRSRREDFDTLAKAVIDLGRELIAES
jgi:aromatic-L-amino-acid decarboxylase